MRRLNLKMEDRELEEALARAELTDGFNISATIRTALRAYLGVGTTVPAKQPVAATPAIIPSLPVKTAGRPGLPVNNLTRSDALRAGIFGADAFDPNVG